MMEKNSRKKEEKNLIESLDRINSIDYDKLILCYKRDTNN